MKSLLRVRSSVALLLVLLALPARAEIIEQILVKVNGEIFTKTELEARQIQLLRQRNELDLKTASDTQLRKALDAVTPRLLADVVDEMLLVQRGKELGYTMSDDQFKTVVDNIKRENKFESEEQLQTALKAENLTIPDLRRSLERQMIAQRVQQNEVMGRVGVSDEEASAYYNAHAEEFTTSPTVTLREILVTVPATRVGVSVGLDDEARAKAKAEAIHARAAAGEDFKQLAMDVSDAPSKAGGGMIGPISLDDLSPELRKMIEPMKVGDVTAVFRTQRGYQLLKLEASTPRQVMALAQAREQISDRVFTDKRRAQLQKYLEKLRAQAIIDWKNQDLKKSYEEGVKLVDAAPPAAK